MNRVACDAEPHPEQLCRELGEDFVKQHEHLATMLCEKEINVMQLMQMLEMARVCTLESATRMQRRRRSEWTWPWVCGRGPQHKRQTSQGGVIQQSGNWALLGDWL
jgi:hypothetical protein